MTKLIFVQKISSLSLTAGQFAIDQLAIEPSQTSLTAILTGSFGLKLLLMEQSIVFLLLLPNGWNGFFEIFSHSTNLLICCCFVAALRWHLIYSTMYISNRKFDTKTEESQVRTVNLRFGFSKFVSKVTSSYCGALNFSFRLFRFS